MSDERNPDAGNPPDDGPDLSEDFEEQEPDESEEVSEDSEPEEGDSEPPADDEPVAARRSTRDRGRRERQSAAIREQRERIDRLERELQAARQAQAAPRVDPYEQARRDQQEREQVALLPLEQQNVYWMQKSEQRVSAALAQQRAELSDQIERASWDNRCASDPMRRRYQQRVEETLNGFAPGQARPTREAVYRYLVGDEIDRKRAADGNRQRSQAARRVRNQTTQPGNGRSDSTRERTQGGDGRDNSLEALRRRVYGSNRPLW